MMRLWKILSGSFHILGQNFVLCYPYFLFFMVLMMVLPESGLGTFDMSGTRTLPLLVLVSGLILLAFAFLAALFQMIVKAVEDYLIQLEKDPAEDEPVEPQTILFSPFLLLREILPGIGTHFVQFTIGGLINLLVFAVVSFLVVYYSSEQLPFVESAYQKLVKLAESESFTMLEFMKSLSKEQTEALMVLGNRMVMGFLAYGVFFMMTVFWPALVVSREVSALKAYWQSVRLYFSDPLTITLLGAIYLLINFTVSLVLSLNPLLMSLRAFISVFVDIYFLTATVLYVLMLTQKTDEPDVKMPQEPSQLNVTG